MSFRILHLWKQQYIRWFNLNYPIETTHYASQLFNETRPARCFKLRSKPSWLIYIYIYIHQSVPFYLYLPLVAAIKHSKKPCLQRQKALLDCVKSAIYVASIINPKLKINHHHHQCMPTVWIPLTLFRYLSLSIFTNPSARAGYDTRSIFQRSLTGLDSEFSFS